MVEPRKKKCRKIPDQDVRERHAGKVGHTAEADALRLPPFFNLFLTVQQRSVALLCGERCYILPTRG